MPKKDQLVPKELNDYIETLQNMNDHDFAEEFMEAEDIVNSYICAVDNGNTFLPNREQLARAILCLTLSIPNPERPKAIWSLIHLLTSTEKGIAFYSIKPQISEIIFLAEANLEKIQRDNEASRSFKDVDDSF